MLWLLAQANPPSSVTIDAQTIGWVIGIITFVFGAMKAAEKWLDSELLKRKEKKANGNGSCQAHSGPLPLSEKSLSKAVDEMHELSFMGLPLAECQRKALERHDAQLNTSVYQERNFQATKIVARELIRKRKAKNNGQKPEAAAEDPNEDTAYWDNEIDKMLKEEP